MVRISNLELIRMLKENSRTSFVDLARKFGVSETAVRKRMKGLEEGGVIRRYTIDVDPRKIGYNAVAIIGLDTLPEKYIRTMDDLKGMNEVVKLCMSTGDHMLMAECWFENSSSLAKFIKRLEKTEGVTRVCPAIINEKVKC